MAVIFIRRQPWENKPNDNHRLSEEYMNKFCDSIDMVDYSIIPANSETKILPKVTYICKNCNGHINPTTMKCEYCDTQYGGGQS